MRISRGLPGLYTAVQMHLHWGGLDLETSGSEHTIDGMRYFAEVLVNGAGWREGSLQVWQLGDGKLQPTKPAGSNAEARGRNGAPVAQVVGATQGLSLVVLARKTKKSHRNSTNILQRWSCSSTFITNLLNKKVCLAVL